MRTRRIFNAFKHAFAGLFYFFTHEKNGRLQFAIGVFTVITSVLLHLTKVEWIVVLFCIGGVLSAEMMNSALEKLCDHLHPCIHPQIKIVKDVAAGAVLFISLISALIGVMIFVPRIFQLL